MSSTASVVLNGKTDMQITTFISVNLDFSVYIIIHIYIVRFTEINVVTSRIH